MFSKLQELREEREEGFTLIELLVVILIIGILSAIAIPAFLNQRKSAVDSSVQSDVSNAAKQVETWVVKQGSTEKDIPTLAATATDDQKKAAGAIGEIKVSDGTILTIKGTSFHYVITGTNTGGDLAKIDSTQKGFHYDSQKGGMLKDATAAPAPTKAGGTATFSK